MNKIILAGASLAAITMAGPAFAQTSSTVTQTGDGNGVTVTQSGDNSSTITQIGDGNSASVTQPLGGANTSTVTQDGDDNNTAQVFQFGTTGTSTISQTDTARGDLAAVIQGVDADENTASITQRGDGVAGDPASGNQALIDQSGGPLNSATITQGGSSNIVEVVQIGDGIVSNNTAIVQIGADQTSTGNLLTINQGNVFGEDRSTNGFVIAVQNGDSNIGSITQSADFGEAIIDQGSAGGSSGNSATITQSADTNIAAINQGDLAASTGNIASITQSSTGNLATIVQNGDNNSATTNQLNGNAISGITQTGTGNTITVNQ